MEEIIPKPILQPGITGIKAETATNLLLSKADADHLTQCCYLAARNYGAKFIGFSQQTSYVENYILIAFQHKFAQTKRILGMVNIYYPLIGFIEIDLQNDNISEESLINSHRFGGGSFQRYPIFEDSSLTHWFEQSGYRLLNQYELLEKLEFDFISNSKGKNKKEKKPTIALKNYHNLLQGDIEEIYRHHGYRFVKIVAEVVFGFFD